jgi:hypothetical protein
MLSLEATYAIAETCLCVHVQTARRVVARHADGVFRPLGLTMNPSTATADLKPLERRGLVAGRSHATDGRVRLVALTDIGRTVLADATELWSAADDRATRRLGANELHALGLALRRISTICQPARVFAAR